MLSVAVIVMNRDRPDLTNRVVEQIQQQGNRPEIEKDLYVIEAGSRVPEGCSKYMTHRFRDRRYRGRYYAFNRGLTWARGRKDYDFYWFVVNDIEFTPEEDCLSKLIACMHDEPSMGLIGPCELDAKDYRGAAPESGRNWHKAATVHGLAHLIRGEVIHTVGYMNPRFRYSQGAGSEYAYKLYRQGWFLAYADCATVHHDQSGSTYGKVVPISRHEYQRRANNFAIRYLTKHYGENWPELFSSVLPPDVEVNTFRWQQDVWSNEWKRNWKEVCPWFWKSGSAVKCFFRSLTVSARS
ncbi:glycosyltransferase family 2 protein [Rubinisphaera brasiliensis]|uniref:Glycosyl transferase family 2 n=1 Tax=Rubinisphaera brasiliensis (strain ATCC 49424 / DSM 5305 / JCM 21570 / IAM 15109 / NBRC 103401 / IFAM 1448) TaxID=756272 RepID=F0SI45_RUBBR|nr:glycosyltransferase [Rubinisphaera brasiliensis]ADY61747.1 glycosyl transferase family 2 [Rubinisphaera brasiliensis DSM 5305]